MARRRFTPQPGIARVVKIIPAGCFDPYWGRAGAARVIVLCGHCGRRHVHGWRAAGGELAVERVPHCSALPEVRQYTILDWEPAERQAGYPPAENGR